MNIQIGCFLSSLLLLGSITSRAQEKAVVDSNYVFSGYTDRLEFFYQMPILPGAIVFLGNSLTEAGRWNDIAPELPILNRGISGDISFGVVARMDEITRHKPSKVFLMIGVNDLKRNVPTEHIIANYYKIVDKIQRDSPKTKIYLNSIMPINESKLLASFKAVQNKDVAILNEALKKLSKERKRVNFVDLHAVVADANGQLKSELTPDGIHLEVSAYILVVDYLKKQKTL